MIEPYEMQKMNLRTDLLPLSRIPNLPKIRLNGYWKHVSFDGDRWIWVNY